jgi:methylated-DNA-[protein]-cysteine S-methyltransferase
MALITRTIPSPLGPLTLVASSTGLREIRFAGESVDAVDAEPGDSAILTRAASQLAEYFAGDRRQFDLPLEPQGTPFQLSVWKVIEDIGFGETISYGEEARRLGDAKKSRAVGSANGRNPLPIVVPCHRIIGSNGSLTGYSGGIEKKACGCSITSAT